MALAVRQALLRQRGYGEVDTGDLERQVAIQRENRIRGFLDEDYSEADNSRWEIEQKRKDEAKEAKKQLLDKKKENIFAIKKKLRVWDTIGSILGVGGLAIAFIELEDNYSDNGKERYESSPQGTFLRCLISVTTLILLVCVYKHHSLIYSMLREKQSSGEGVGSTFYKSNQFKKCLLEIMYCTIHCPPGLDLEFEFEQLNGKLLLSADSVLSCMMILRVYFFMRGFKHYSKFANNHADEVCETFGTEASVLFVMKSEFKERPYVILGATMLVSIFTFALAARVFERPYNEDNGGDKDFSYVWNALWMIVVVMTTVGYGDFFPQTHLGRFIVVISCFWGVFMVSMMVVTLTENSEFSKGEKRAYEILARLKAKQKATQIAKHIVLASFQFFMVKKLKNSGTAIVGSKRHIRDIEGTYIHRYNNLIGLVQKFSEQRELWKKWELEDGEMLRQLNEKIDVDIEELKNQVADICEVEQQLQRVEKFQASSMEATRISLLHMEELNVQLKKILDNMSAKI